VTIMADNKTPQVPDSSQRSKEVDLLTHWIRDTNGTSSRYTLKDLKLVLDAVQRVVCLVLAAWIILHNNNVLEFLAILSVSQLDPRRAKDIFLRVLKGLVSESK
jgi:hypothetical protein